MVALDSKASLAVVKSRTMTRATAEMPTPTWQLTLVVEVLVLGVLMLVVLMLTRLLQRVKQHPKTRQRQQ